MTKMLCPYCSVEISMDTVKYSCPKCNNEKIRPSTMEKFKKIVPHCDNPLCHDVAATIRCQSCNAVLPSDIFAYSKFLRFSLIGVPGCGKSNFLTTMIKEMMDGRDHIMSISSMNATTENLFISNKRMIYDEHHPVNATDRGTPEPQLWRLKDLSKSRTKSVPTYEMTIFDGAGENSVNIDPKVSQYIESSKELVILIDPLSLNGVRKKLDPAVVEASKGKSSDFSNDLASKFMIDNLAEYIRTCKHLKPNEKIDCDVAIVFAKIDLVEDTMGANTVLEPSPHNAAKAFVKSDADRVDQEIRDWLLENNESQFIDSIDTNFLHDKVRFFGVSSFGRPPLADSSVGEIMPHRILDPVMWMLAQEKIIPTVK